MKLHTDALNSLNTVTAYGDGYIEINARRHETSVLVTPEQAVAAWPARDFDALAAEQFEAVLERSPEVVILGTGPKQRFVHPRLVAALIARRIGVECMDTQAACRTYNILMAEGRNVAGVFLLA
ncbi:Mth938-like domain-containing protein [Derxia gummosa]|uniref:Mth938-like domain-containing protein n=1 Tax=Derxia gummosa DSM 723 TaxID=1121388 RepID=A0A8B6X344_9BURK|nr:Mth938-like domain-containing protein [Derxia gummosa]